MFSTSMKGAASAGKPKGAGCTLAYSNTTQDAGATDHFTGQIWTDSISNTLCKVDFLITAHGTISDRTFNAYVYSLDGSNNLISILATSDGVTGDNAWSLTYVSFTFSTPFTLSASTNYGIIYTSTPFDGSFVNYGEGFVKTTGSVIPGQGESWDGGGTPQFNDPNFERAIKLYFS